MRYCGRAACRKNRKRQLVYRCWKSYSTRAAAFLEKKDMVLMQTACDDSKCRNIHLHWKGSSSLDKGMKTPLQPLYLELSQEGEIEIFSPFRCESMMNWTKNGLSFRKIQKATDKEKIRKKYIYIYKNNECPELRGWLCYSCILYTLFNRAARRNFLPALHLRAPSFRGILCPWSHTPTCTW